MYYTVSFNEFMDLLKKAGRDYYSYDGYRAIFDYLREIEEETGNDIEVDPIAISSHFTEYNDIDTFNSDYDEQYKTIGEISDEYEVLHLPNGNFIIAEDFIIIEDNPYN